MLGYDASLLALLPLLERLDCPEGGQQLTLRLEGLGMGDIRFISGEVRLRPDGR